MLVLLPVFLLRIILKLTQKKKITFYIGEIIILNLIILFSILNAIIRDQQSSLSLSLIHLEVWYINFSSHLIIAPILGDKLTFQLIHSSSFFIVLSTLITAGLGYFIYTKWNNKNILILSLLGIITLVPVMISMARVANIEVLLHFLDYN